LAAKNTLELGAFSKADVSHFFEARLMHRGLANHSYNRCRVADSSARKFPDWDVFEKV